MTVDVTGRYWLGSQDPCQTGGDETCVFGLVTMSESRVLQVEGGAWDTGRDWPDRSPYRYASCIDGRPVMAYETGSSFHLAQTDDTGCSAVAWARLPSG